MEIIDIDFNDLEPITMKMDEKSTSSSLGPGIELLMNDKKRSSNNIMNVDLGELDDLEKELNDLSKKTESNASSTFEGTTKTISDFTSNLFNFGGSKKNTVSSTGNNGNQETNPHLGQATKETLGSTKTWDGFSKMNEMESGFSANVPKLNEREKRRKQKLMLKKLEEWNEKGLIKNISHLNSESSYEDIEDEYESALEDKRKKDSIKLQGWWFMTFVNSIEYANAAFNPFDINLDGWGEQISEDIDSYEDIFNELHDKYKGGKMSPELSLLLRIGFSAAVVNFTNKALSSATPGFNDVIRQSPELMKMFTNATVNTMNQSSPGFAFANNLMNQPNQVNQSFGPPPPPVETKNMPRQPRAGNSMTFTEPPSNRPDIQRARGENQPTMFQEKGVDINRSFTSANESKTIFTPSPNSQPPSQNSTIPTPVAQMFQKPIQTQPQSNRPDMRGPQNLDLENIFSGLKTKTESNHQIKQPQNHENNMTDFYPDSILELNRESLENMQNQQTQQNHIYNNDDSLISISSLKSIQQGASMPKKSRRKNRSDKNQNTVSLDI